MTPITALGSRYGIQGALGRSVKRAAAGGLITINALEGGTTRNTYPTRSYMASGLSMSTGLLRFDLSAISSSIVVTGVELHLFKSSVSGSALEQTTHVYAVAEANADWQDGVSQTPATQGQSTYGFKHCYGNDDPANEEWAGGQTGCSTSGTDYEATSFGSFTGNRVDAQYTEYTITFNAAGIAKVQSWLGEVSNPGFVFPTSMTWVQVGAEEPADAYKAKLVIYY